MTAFCTEYLERGALESPMLFGLFCIIRNADICIELGNEASALDSEDVGAATVNNLNIT